MNSYFSNSVLFAIAFFGIINAISFFLMVWDKMSAKKKGAERISEGVLFFLASIGGGVGVYMGMFLLRHKTRKWYFILGIPILLFQNGVCLYLAYLF